MHAGIQWLPQSSQAIPLQIGRDYQVVTVSFDPRETPELAAEKEEVATYGLTVAQARRTVGIF